MTEFFVMSVMGEAFSVAGLRYEEESCRFFRPGRQCDADFDWE